MLFLIFSVIVFIFVALFVPKKLPRNELYAIALFSIVFGLVTDIVLDLKYNLYGYFYPGVDFAGFLPIMFLFPSSGVLFMNYYPFKKSIRNQIIYLLGWTIFSLFFEYLSIVSGYFYYNGWNLWISAIIYPFLLLIQLLHLKIYRVYQGKNYLKKETR
ncbi:CBO0543 family protein [Mesobacillus maritimus]|uniref:CBO0543 family protein n=1 Tax=Mesobacillus maritimus TaxID=1643336 RepID=UPI00255970D0|nr:CBO0543 family protein [Mesobacillus maritimus]